MLETPSSQGAELQSDSYEPQETYGDEGSKLYAQFRKDQIGAFDQLEKLYSKVAYSVAFRILNNRLDAEDCVQHAWQKALEDTKFNVHDKFYPWFLKIVFNTAHDINRRKCAAKRKMTGENIPAEEIADPRNDIDAVDTRDFVETVFREMNDRYSEELLREHFAERTSVPTMLKIRQCCEQTLRTHITTARNRFTLLCHQRLGH